MSSPPSPNPFQQKYRVGADFGVEGDEVVVFGPIEDRLEGMRPLLWFSEWGDGVFVGSLPESTQRRIDKLVDRTMFRDEAQYHHQVQFMQRWLDMTQWAMDDEGVPQRVIERVLNRLVYGAPDPNDAHERVATHEQMREMMEKMPLNTRAVSDLLNGPVQKGKISNG